jgi:hypothetical protein
MQEERKYIGVKLLRRPVLELLSMDAQFRAQGVYTLALLLHPLEIWALYVRAPCTLEFGSRLGS